MNDELEILLRAMQEAGEAILKMQKTGFSVSRKANNDIVTKADLLANDILRAHLSKQFSDDAWLSEESVDDICRLSNQRVWIVDPIDGTKEFSQGIPEYAISVALVENGVPIVSSVFNPATNELFYAKKGHGAWLNKRAIQCIRNGSERYLLLASRSEYQRGDWKAYQTEHHVKQVGSIAYKLALIAAGKADATFSLGHKHEWDIAAGALLVSEAGGMVTNKHKEELVFNRSDVKVNGIIATTKACYHDVIALCCPHHEPLPGCHE